MAGLHLQHLICLSKQMYVTVKKPKWELSAWKFNGISCADLSDRPTTLLLFSQLSPMQEFINVWVRDPRIQKEDFWHAYMDYEICIHTNSLAFNKKSSCVRRRYSEFVWLRQKLQSNALLHMNLPELPPKNPFFSLNNARQIAARMEGLRHFLEQIVHCPVLLSDSCLHLFLQSQLSVRKISACAAGRSRYTVAQAIQSCGPRTRFTSDILQDEGDSDSE